MLAGNGLPTTIQWQFFSNPISPKHIAVSATPICNSDVMNWPLKTKTKPFADMHCATRHFPVKATRKVKG